MMFDETPEQPYGDSPEVATVGTPNALRLTAAVYETEVRSKGSACVAVRLQGRVIARSFVPEDEVDRYISFFLKPAHVLLSATVGEPGVQCRLGILVDSELLDPDANEPWRASALANRAESEIEMVPQYIGDIVRFAADRKHPEDLQAEAADILLKVLAGHTVEPIDKVLEHLL